MTFEQAKAKRAVLEVAERAAAAALAALPGVGSGRMGLTPDSAKTQFYWIAKDAQRLAFTRLQTFNGFYVRRFKAELTAERKAKLAA